MIIRINKKLLFPSLLLVLSFAFLPTSLARAQGLPFGGLVSASFPCTCSFTLAVWMTPLYLGGPIILTGPMVYSPYATIPYGNFLIGVPGTWELGTYLPGAQACWMYVGLSCVPIPMFGLMTKVGTSGI